MIGFFLKSLYTQFEAVKTKTTEHEAVKAKVAEFEAVKTKVTEQGIEITHLKANADDLHDILKALTDKVNSIDKHTAEILARINSQGTK